MGWPERILISRVASRFDESLLFTSTMGLISLDNSPQKSSICVSEALAQLILPKRVFISPLWPKNLMGWASGHFGSVLVLNLRW